MGTRAVGSRIKIMKRGARGSGESGLVIDKLTGVMSTAPVARIASIQVEGDSVSWDTIIKSPVAAEAKGEEIMPMDDIFSAKIPAFKTKQSAGNLKPIDHYTYRRPGKGTELMTILGTLHYELRHYG